MFFRKCIFFSVFDITNLIVFLSFSTGKYFNRNNNKKYNHLQRTVKKIKKQKEKNFVVSFELRALVSASYPPLAGNMEAVVFTLDAWQAVLLCLLFAVIYVGSLYAWINNGNRTRDHPEIIKRRFVSVGIVALLVPPLLWCFSSYPSTSNLNGRTLFEWLGLRFWGLIPALVLPLFLTMILFAGPLYLHYIDGVFNLYLEPKYWSNSFKSLIWLRNHLVAPFSEEFIFRACMLPVLVPSIGEWYAVFCCPLFFGVAHFHHMIERVILGQQGFKDGLKQSVFQLFYTTIFGAYSAFLFLRTGHLVAPVIAHAFCNHMGFPPFSEVMAHQQPGRTRIVFFFIAGLSSWLLLLFPLTTSSLYSNNVYHL